MSTPIRLTKHVQVVIYELQAYIDDNHSHQNLKISDLAMKACIDRKVLEAGFKQIFHMTIKKYCIRRRMEFSQQLLDEGSLTIKEIAHKCGYRSQNSYTRCFKQIYKVTPTEWQNRAERAQVFLE